ncbi:MAG TPA: hypothetical protein VIK72_14285 [Clostridiaceae bacterium]
MVVGYILGCLLSILLWKIDKQMPYVLLRKLATRRIHNKYLKVFLYVLIVSFLCFLFSCINSGFLSSFVTALLLIDISNTERENLNLKGKIEFYNSLSTISRAMVIGFIAPLFYIALLGNLFSILIMLVINIGLLEDHRFFKFTNNVLLIIPSIITDIILYFVYLTRNKQFNVDFKGDFLFNLVYKPLLNTDIIAANIEAVNFYQHYNRSSNGYVKSYGGNRSKVDIICIKDYININYFICTFIYAIFLLSLLCKM